MYLDGLFATAHLMQQYNTNFVIFLVLLILKFCFPVALFEQMTIILLLAPTGWGQS
jgi:hypothetical protein